MSDDIVKNLKEPSHWLRILFMLGFAVVLYVVGLVVMVLTLAQILFSLLTGKDNPNLRSLGSSLSRYIFEILMFLTYNSEVRPFPFTPFPVMEPVESDEPVKPFKPAEEPAVDLSAGMHNPYSAEAAAAQTATTKSDNTKSDPFEPFSAESDPTPTHTELDVGKIDSDTGNATKPDR